MRYYVGDLCDVLDLSLYDKWIDSECPSGKFEGYGDFFYVFKSSPNRLMTISVVPERLWDAEIVVDESNVFTLENPILRYSEGEYIIYTDNGNYVYDVENRRFIYD